MERGQQICDSKYVRGEVGLSKDMGQQICDNGEIQRAHRGCKPRLCLCVFFVFLTGSVISVIQKFPPSYVCLSKFSVINLMD
jgi:hypothetical protein